MWWSCHLMRCDCLCGVMSRDAMRCHVMCAHVMCPAMVTLCVRSGSVTMWWSKVLFCTTKYYCVLQSTTPVLLCTTQYYNVLLQYYKVLLQYYSVLQSTTPVLLCTSTTPVLFCTTKYYSSTTRYYTVLLQYYSSTTLYYKGLLQYYSVLQSTTPVLLCTTKYYSSTTLYYTVLLQYYSSTILYCKVLLQYYSVLQSSIHDWSFTHMNRYLHCAEQQEPSSNSTKYCTCHAKWLWWLIRVTYENVIYNARSNKPHTTTSPNTAPATQNESHDWSASHMKRHLQCAEEQESQSNFTKYCACHAKWISWLIHIRYETSFTMRGATRVTLQLRQILRMPRKLTLMIVAPHIWNVIYNVRSNKPHTTTSPNTAPATQNESHDWSASHMKRHLQCAEQAQSASNLTKYCACHEICKFNISARHPWIASANIKTIRG